MIIYWLPVYVLFVAISWKARHSEATAGICSLYSVTSVAVI